MVEMQMIFWVTVALTVLSGAASAALAARRNGSVASYRVADRLAQIAVIGPARLSFCWTVRNAHAVRRGIDQDLGYVLLQQHRERVRRAPQQGPMFLSVYAIDVVGCIKQIDDQLRTLQVKRHRTSPK